MGKKNKFKSKEEKKEGEPAAGTEAAPGAPRGPPPGQTPQGASGSGNTSQQQPQQQKKQQEHGQKKENVTQKSGQDSGGDWVGAGKKTKTEQQHQQQRQGQQQGVSTGAVPKGKHQQQEKPQQQPQQQWRQPQGQQWKQGQPQQQQKGQPQQQQGQSQQQQQWKSQHQQQGQPQQQWRQPQGQPQQQQKGQPQQQQQGQSQQQQQWKPQHQQQGQPQQWNPQQQQQGQQQQQRKPQQGQPQQQRQPQQQQQGQQQQPRQPQPRPQQPQLGHPSQTSTPSQYSSSSSLTSTSSKSMSSSVSGIARGTKGVKGVVDTNYLRMDLDRMPAIAYHYDVTITPDRPKKFIRPAFNQFNRLHFNNIAMAFDGKKSFYTVEKLPFKEFEETIELEDSGSRKIEFKIAIKETNDMEIDLNSLKSYFRERIYDKPMRALQCIEVVLSNPCHFKGARAGRSFYMEPRTKCDLYDGFEMYLGLYQAAILGDQPFLNVDISHKSFPSASWLTDYLKDHCRVQNLNQTLDYRNVGSLKTYLNGVNVVYVPLKNFGSFERTYKVNSITEKGAADLIFTLEDGTKLSVAQYFQRRGAPLKYPKLNCLHVGSTVKSNFVPIEFCRIPPGQTLMKKDGPRQVQQMIRFAATSTDERKRKIMEMLQHFNHNSDSIIQKFGIQIGGNFIEVPMRLLSSPLMEYFSGETIRCNNGSWRMNDSTKFLVTKQASTGHKWAVIYSKKGRINYNAVQNLAQMLSRAGTKLSMGLANKPEIFAFDSIDQTLRDLRKDNFDLVIVIIPNFGTSYADIKQNAELRHGILTQCIKEFTVDRKCDMQTIANLLLKINAKLNGTNHKICARTHVPLKNVMFLGADVTHPSPDQRHIPSVVGVAASHDEHGACYNMQYRLQKSTVENIEDMDSIFMHHMNVYFKYNKRYPDHVIYYRDGVSDGQFPIVKKFELGGIRAACNKLRVSVKLTCIIVVKRHHTRFFPKTSSQDRFNKFNNVTPGTVVDQVIVHPNEVQFFMVSHQSIQGTAKPTRYNVIEDDAKLDIDLLQTLTHNLCHLFPRCNRVVSYPAPAYLAHLVAYRGRVYLEGARSFGELKKEYQQRLVNTDFMERNPMYFV